MKFLAALALNVCLILAQLGNLAYAKSLKQNEKIVFDKNNYLVFEDVGRVEGKGGGIAFGKKVVLHVTRDGKMTDMDLGELRKKDALSTDVNEIRYRDKDRIWILSRLGRILDGAVLFNLATQKPDWTRTAIHFALSPDARHLAYAFPVDRQLDCPAVFVNTVMVFPKVVAGFNRQSQKGPGDPKNENGRNSCSYLSEDQMKMHLTSKIAWLNNNEIQFMMAPGERAAQRSSKQVRITGVGDVKNEKAIQVFESSAVPPAARK